MTRFMRALRNYAKRNLKRLFELGQRLGVDILPRHFYSSIPDFRELRRSDGWRRPYGMTGVAGADLDGQEQALRAIMTDAARQRLFPGNVWPDACHANGEAGYGQADADVLFALILNRRPKRVIQIGCGVSTAIMLAAAREAAYPLHILCVDPYPTAFLTERAKANEIDLLAQPAQNVEETTLANLEAGELLFIDSSHTTKPGSEVHHIILRVLPRLVPGVWIHFHDINFPYDFGPSIFGPADLFFGSESCLLHAYLIHNTNCRIAFSLSMLHHARPALLKELLPNYLTVATDRGINPPGSEGLTPSAAYLKTA